MIGSRSHITSQCAVQTVITPSPNMRLNPVKWLLSVIWPVSTALSYHVLGTYRVPNPIIRHLGLLWGHTQTLPSWS